MSGDMCSRHRLTSGTGGRASSIVLAYVTSRGMTRSTQSTAQTASVLWSAGLDPPNGLQLSGSAKLRHKTIAPRLEVSLLGLRGCHFRAGD